MATPQPHLSGDLRLALSVLYSLPTASDFSIQKPTSKEAHDYLMQFQCRNVRRKLSSKLKSLKNKTESSAGINILQSLEAGDVGSSWLACLGLLASHRTSTNQQIEVNYAEALFAAQTMVHRLRRVKLSEAIDLEFESPQSLPPNHEMIVDMYLQWSSTLNSTFLEVINKYHPQSSDEEAIKGELTVLSLTTILYCQTLSCNQDFSSIRPLLSTIASALAVTTARLRYTSASIPSEAPNTQPIVKMIINTLTMVHQVVSSTSGANPAHAAHAHSTVLFMCMSAIPDAILAGGDSGGGAYGRMSMDPRCFTAVTTEVRTQGLSQVWDSFMEMSSPSGDQLILFLEMCESWAKYVPLPKEFVRRSVVLIKQSFIELAISQPSQHQVAAGRAALQYWIAIMEGGSWTVEEVLASSLIQKYENSQQPNKKKQSSKSKKRQKETLEERTSQNQYVLAQNEVHHRSEMACEVTMQTWNAFRPLLTRELSTFSDVNDEVQGDGPVGGIIACANACLPYLVRQPIQNSELLQLFVSISDAVNEICSSAARSVRGFAAESLYMLHDIVMTVGFPTDNANGYSLQNVIVDHFYKCCMNLASQCGYPGDYFKDLRENNEEELEMERNDVRDVLRCVSGHSSSGKNQSNPSGTRVAFCVLVKLLEACAQPIMEVGTEGKQLFPESALHAFSALARPLHTVALHYHSSNSAEVDRPLSMALEIMCIAGRCIIQAFGQSHNPNLLPLSRIYSLATASLSPAFSSLGTTKQHEAGVVQALEACYQASVLSLVHLPELSSPSTLRSSRFDVRGAMRSPGGEDHVGILALMRLTTESLTLTSTLLRAIPLMVTDLCCLYQQLKQMEKERGKGVLHGKGVLPKSRRILLGVICHLELSSEGQAGASAVLEDLFKSSVLDIANVGNVQQAQLTPATFFDICGNVFDLAAFSKNMIHSLYDFNADDSESPLNRCLSLLSHAGVAGFNAIADPNSFSREYVIEWNRLRAALFVLMRSSGMPDLPHTVTDLVKTNIVTECIAVLHQCKMGPRSGSAVFNDEVISDEVVPAGLMLQVLGEILETADTASVPMGSLTNTIRILYDSRSTVLQVVVSDCPCPIEKGSFCDPRPTIAETWFLAMNKLLKPLIAQGFFQSAGRDNDLCKALQQMLVESCVSIIILLLYPSISKTQNKRANDAGMSFDGAQTLAMMEFLHLYFSLGPSMLQLVAIELLGNVPVDLTSVQHLGTDPNLAGISIIGAGLFRAAQGGLPPWAVECIPSVYSSFFTALNRDPATFAQVFNMAIHIRLGNQNFGGVQASQLLGGKYFQSMGDKSKQTFISQATELATKNNPKGWLRLKALIKKACGGKKKDTDFKQKPAFTRWDALDRI
eukprot:CAMPEP_0194171408 /NCGR_PEP_ID=MMETSP0154-20130528/5987_1 /TAXON_ID=1049557 /ORGANISM="Thalassiothrix antarctica, Strain L6-D1" /LENGTH=1365 /DNA_ID=CAMNT_0038883703 /DNA_START=23 /DNA_END=4120 /DNA_ORIENTATION=+